MGKTNQEMKQFLTDEARKQYLYGEANADRFERIVLTVLKSMLINKDSVPENLGTNASVAAEQVLARIDAFRIGHSRPHIVCLCGSTRFYEAFKKANYEETMKGSIVLSVGFFPDRDEVPEVTEGEKEALDYLHTKKIDMCDEIFVLNVDGYIGESTRSEIDHAEMYDVPVRYLEPVRGE